MNRANQVGDIVKMSGVTATRLLRAFEPFANHI